MAAIVWSPQAINDIDKIAEFISKDSLQYAKVQTASFIEKAGELINQPHKGRIVPELGINSIRQVLCGHYRIIYEINGDAVSILTIHHQSRLLKSRAIIRRPNGNK